MQIFMKRPILGDFPDTTHLGPGFSGAFLNGPKLNATQIEQGKDQ